MEKIMQNKLTIKIICAALAIILWFYVSYQENPSMTKTVEDIPITITGEQALKENGFSVYSVSSNHVDIIATAKRLTLSRLSGKNTYAAVNVSALKRSGKHTVPATISSTLTSDASFSLKGKNIVVTIEPISSKTLSINPDILQAENSSIKIAYQKLSSKTTVVTAPKSILKDIDSVKTEKITPSKDNKKYTAKLVAYGKNGIPLEGVEFSPTTVELSLQFYDEKTVPVVLKTNADETHALPDKASIKIYGTAEELSQITQIETEAIDVDKHKKGSTATLKLVIPKNIQLDDSQPDEIEVKIESEYLE